MKKKFLTAFVLTVMSFSAMAQSDGFFYNEYKENNETRAIDLPGMGKAYFFAEGSEFEQFIEESVSAPVGNGLLILIGASLCYAINKRNRKEKTI